MKCIRFLFRIIFQYLFIKKNGESNESIGQGTKEKFYEMLANEGVSKQIIIFDNEEPGEKVKGRINYLHFSGETSIGRKGFIPENG